MISLMERAVESPVKVKANNQRDGSMDNPLAFEIENCVSFCNQVQRELKLGSGLADVSLRSIVKTTSWRKICQCRCWMDSFEVCLVSELSFPNGPKREFSSELGWKMRTEILKEEKTVFWSLENVEFTKRVVLEFRTWVKQPTANWSCKNYQFWRIKVCLWKCVSRKSEIWTVVCLKVKGDVVIHLL